MKKIILSILFPLLVLLTVPVFTHAQTANGFPAQLEPIYTNFHNNGLELYDQALVAWNKGDIATATSDLSLSVQVFNFVSQQLLTLQSSNPSLDDNANSALQNLTSASNYCQQAIIALTGSVMPPFTINPSGLALAKTYTSECTSDDILVSNYLTNNGVINNYCPLWGNISAFSGCTCPTGSKALNTGAYSECVPYAYYCNATDGVNGVPTVTNSDGTCSVSCPSGYTFNSSTKVCNVAPSSVPLPPTATPTPHPAASVPEVVPTLAAPVIMHNNKVSAAAAPAIPAPTAQSATTVRTTDGISASTSTTVAIATPRKASWLSSLIAHLNPLSWW